MSSSSNTNVDDRRSGKICNSCYNVTVIFDFCLDCEVTSIRCNLCRKTFAFFDIYKTHFKKHSLPPKKFFHGEITLKDDRIEPIFVCPFCHCVFGNIKKCTGHITTIHEEVKAFVCYHCGNTYRSKNSLSNHIATHIKAPSYECHFCGKTYHLLHLLKYHILSHMNQKDYKCSMCDASFNEGFLLTRHMRQHTLEKLYKCDLCEKAFTFHFTLKRHKLTHTEEQRFYCNMCEKTYKWKTDLIRHIKGHLDEKAHCCGVCGKAFIRKCSLTAHMARHSGAKSFMCFCGKTFKYSGNLSKHRRDIHKNTKVSK